MNEWMNSEWLNFSPQSQAAEQCLVFLFVQASASPVDRDVFVNFPDFSLQRASWYLTSPLCVASRLYLLNIQIYHYPFVGMRLQFTLCQGYQTGAAGMRSRGSGSQDQKKPKVISAFFFPLKLFFLSPIMVRAESTLQEFSTDKKFIGRSSSKLCKAFT